MNKVDRHFALARIVATKGDTLDARRRYRLGAVGIRYDGAIVSASNLPNRTPASEAHAEARLVRKLDVGSIVFVVRITRKGLLTTARPCKRCRAKMRARGVKRVYYSITENEHGVLRL